MCNGTEKKQGGLSVCQEYLGVTVVSFQSLHLFIYYLFVCLFVYLFVCVSVCLLRAYVGPDSACVLDRCNNVCVEKKLSMCERNLKAKR